MKINPLDEVRSGLVLMIFIGTFLGLGILTSVFVDANSLQNMSPGEQFALDNYLGVLVYAILAALLWQISSKQRDELAALLFHIPDTQTIKSYIWLSAGMVILSIGLTYLLYYPLSFFVPDFVQSWLLDAPYLLYWDENGWYPIGNLAGVILAVIMAPIVEEFLFRGYLLNRWTLKLGATPAMLLSAGLFAILHPDALGAFVFAIIMSLLYLKTRSLIAPILVHMSNNAIAVTLEWLDRRYWAGFETTTIADFQEFLWLGIICLIVGSYWVWSYVRRHFIPVKHLLAKHEKNDSDNNSLYL